MTDKKTDEQDIDWGEEFSKTPEPAEETVPDAVESEPDTSEVQPETADVVDAEESKDKVQEPEPDVKAESTETAPDAGGEEKSESDEKSAQEEKTVAEIAEEQKKKKEDKKKPKHTGSKIEHFKSWFKEHWADKKWRAKFIAGSVVLLLLLSLLIPPVRYGFLNLIGLRTRSTFKVVDAETNLPLSGADVQLAGKETETDKNGKVELTGLKHGKTNLTIEQAGFAKVDEEVTLGFGTNNFEDFELKTAGTRFSLLLEDFFSEDPIKDTTVTFGESTAISDDKGVAELVIEPTSKEEISVTIDSEDFADKEYKVSTTTDEQQTLELLPSRKHYFISQRDGGFGVYSMLLDGSEQEVLLEPTGNEEADIRLSIHPDGKIGALVSTRAGERNSDGFLLKNLDIIDLESGEAQTIATSERIELLDWSGDKLLFISQSTGTSRGNPERTKIRSFTIGGIEARQIAASNYFQDAIVADGVVYYIPYDYGARRVGGVRRVNVDGRNDIEIASNTNIYRLFRTSYDEFVYEVAFPSSQWFRFNVDSGSGTELPGRPADLREVVFQASQDGSQAAFVERRDGKGVLLLTDTETNEDSVAVTQSGLENPVQWLRDDLVVYRVVVGGETADYILNLNNDEQSKLIDVYHADGIDRYHY